jgi:hypothetical protein
MFPLLPPAKVNPLLVRGSPSLFLASKLLIPPPSNYPFSKEEMKTLTKRMTQSMTSIRHKPWVYDPVYVRSIMELTPEDVRYARSLFVAIIGDFHGKGSESWVIRSIPATDKFPACSVAMMEDPVFTRSGKDIDKVIRWNLMLRHVGDICSYYVMNARDTNQAFRYLTEYAKIVRAKNPTPTPTPSKATPGVVRDPFTHGFSLGEISRRCSYMRTQEERKERLRRAQMDKPNHSLGGGGGGGGGSRRHHRSRRRHVAKSKRHYSRRR